MLFTHSANARQRQLIDHVSSIFSPSTLHNLLVNTNPFSIDTAHLASGLYVPDPTHSGSYSNLFTREGRMTRIVSSIILTVLLCAIFAQPISAFNLKAGAVNVLTNQTSNTVAAFDRAPDGTLPSVGQFSTGGAGNPIAHCWKSDDPSLGWRCVDRCYTSASFPQCGCFACSSNYKWRRCVECGNRDRG